MYVAFSLPARETRANQGWTDPRVRDADCALFPQPSRLVSKA